MRFAAAAAVIILHSLLTIVLSSILHPALSSFKDPELKLTKKKGVSTTTATTHQFSKAELPTAITTTRLVTISAADRMATRKMLPLLAGNLPRMT